MLPVLLAVATLAAAAQPPSAPSAMTGRWVLARDGEGAPSCDLSLGPQPVIGGYKVTAAPACRRVVSWSQDFYAWYLNTAGVVVLADPTRKPVMRFVLRQGAYVADGPNGALFIISRPARELTQAQRMRGHWRLAALGGVPLCDFDMTSNAGGTAGTLKMRTGCAAPWKGRAIAAWSLKGRRITLADAAGKPVVAIADCGLGGCTGELPNGDFVGFTPIFE